MKNECNIVQDMLPLYAEDMVSDDTAAFVQEHLERCPDCRAALEQMKTPEPPRADADMSPFRKLKRKIIIRRVVIITVVLVLAVLYLMLLDVIPWRRGRLEDIYGFDSYEPVSVYALSMQDRDILLSTEEKDLAMLRETLLDLDCRAIWEPRGEGRLTLDPSMLELFIVLQNADGDTVDLWIRCTSDDVIYVYTQNIPHYRQYGMYYRVKGGYDLSWVYG